MLGPTLGEDALLLHAHGGSSEHLHFVSPQADERHDHHADHQEFELSDGHDGHETGCTLPGSPTTPSEQEHESSRILISFPGALHFSSISSGPLLRSAMTLMLCHAAEPRLQSRAAAFIGTGPPGRAGPGKERSGIAAVLATSRAILI
jgi:hypothetical protein